MTFHFASHYFQVMQLLFGLKVDAGAVKIEDLLLQDNTNSISSIPAGNNPKDGAEKLSV
jgi:hypothetical protein